MNKLSSRKLWAFTVWVLIVMASLIFEREVSEVLISAFSKITMLYLAGQSAIDAIGKKGE